MAKPVRFTDNFHQHVKLSKMPCESTDPEDDSSIPEDHNDPLDSLREQYDAHSELDFSAARVRLNCPHPPASLAVARLLGETRDPNEKKRLGVLLMALRLVEWCDAGLSRRSRAIRRNIVLLRVDHNYTYETTCAEISRKYRVSRKAISKHWKRFKRDFPGLVLRKK